MRMHIREGLKSLTARLIYRASEYSFDTAGSESGSYGSIQVNDLQIEFDYSGEAFSIWGYSPSQAWIDDHVRPPKESLIGILSIEDEMTPGIALRVNESESHWQVRRDRTTGWLSFAAGSIDGASTFVEFLPGCIAGLSNGNLTALWLHPEVISE